jgi:hypothetical protein
MGLPATGARRVSFFVARVAVIWSFVAISLMPGSSFPITNSSGPERCVVSLLTRVLSVEQLVELLGR